MAVEHPEKNPNQGNNLALFIEIGKTLTSSLELNDVLNKIMDQISKLLRPKSWSLMLVDEKSGELYFQILVGDAARHLKGKRMKIGEGIPGFVAKTGEMLILSSTEVKKEASRFGEIIEDFENSSIICLPLKSKGRILGVIELVKDTSSSTITEHEKTLLMTLADYAAIAIENAIYFRKVQELSIRDDVTGLYNSRHMNNVLDLELKRAKRYGKPLSIIFLDLDFFKNINDTHGHLIGSQLLREVAGLLKRNLREIDVPTRYGGDEFVIILPETDKEGALKVAWRLREAIREATFEMENGLIVRITASFGVSCYPEDTDNKLDLIRLADQAMYRVKMRSRDSVEPA